MEIKEIQSKSILTPSKLPAADYVVNPYLGCRFACSYCYASFMGRFADKSVADWGEYVYPKMNAAELLRKEILSLKNKGKGKVVLFSSVTDPYQGLEVKYQLTRKCLEVLIENHFEGEVSFLTKSDLILRDLDLIKKLKHTEVGLTITTTDDSISRYFEKYAPPASKRLETLKKLNEEGVKTYAFIGPLLPHFVSKEIVLDKLFKAIAETGNKEIFVEHINLSPYIFKRLKEDAKELGEKIITEFYTSKSENYREQLNQIIHKLIKRYGLKLKLQKVIYHGERKNTQIMSE